MLPGNLMHDLHQLLKTDEPAHLGPQPRSGTLSTEELDDHLGTAFKGTKIPPSVENLFRSIFYLWHDHLDESHHISQSIENQDGSLAHAIMHRREPDYSNAKYWFRRVGHHPSFLSLAPRASELLAKHNESDLASRLLPNRTWDPFAFVDAVEDAAEGQFRSKVPILEELQKLEFECFIENLVNRL